MSSYNDSLGHASMLFDHVRNSAYEKAIKEKVTPDSVVLDLGAGLGLHGLMAARAGAKKVFLVDPSPTIFSAEQVARANGFDNVVCIQSRAEDLEIDEKVDLIISVFTGNFLLAEDLLPSLFYARDNFLREGGSLIPDCARMMVQPVSMPDYYQRSVARWNDNSEDSLQKRFGIDYSVLRKMAENYLYYDDFTESEWTNIASAQLLTEIDFFTAKKAESFDTVSYNAEVSADFHGWLCWFDMRLGDQWLSTSPTSEKLHWNQVFFPNSSQVSVTKGDAVSLHMKRPEYGDWTWTTETSSQLEHSGEPKGKQKSQSTFLSRVLRPEDIRKQAPNYSLNLSENGQILKFLLESFDGSKSSQQLADKLVETFPERFPNQHKAMLYIQLQGRLLGD